MANEATLYHETAQPIPMTCANGTGVERGAILTLSDPKTAALCTVSTAAAAGIAAEEKIASDGRTSLPVYREGVFKVTASGAITVGEAVVCDGDNKISATVAANEHVLGEALETATDGETFLMELKPRHRNL